MKTLSILIYTVFLQLYVMYVAPTVTPIDSGDLVTACIALGNAHSPGYPVHAILGKLASFSPFGNIAYRVNMISCVGAALTIIILFRLICLVSKNAVMGLAAIIFFGLSRTFWSQSEISEVYTVYFMLFILVMLFTYRAISFKGKGRIPYKWLYVVSLITGISLGIHQMMMFFLPAFLFWIIYELGTSVLRWKLALGIIIFFMVGYSVQLYLPVRAAQDPFYAWESPATWTMFKNLVTTSTFNSQRFTRSLDLFGEHVINYFHSLINQYNVLFVIISIPGFFILKYKNRGFFMFSSMCFLVNLVSSTALFNLSRRWFFTLDVFYMPGILVMSIWGGMVIGEFYNFIKQTHFRAGLISGLIALPMIFSFQLVDKSYETYFKDRHLMSDWAKLLLSCLPSNSILILQQDEIFGAWYLKYVEKMGDHVELLHHHVLYAPGNWFWNTVQDKNLQFIVGQVNKEYSQYQDKYLMTLVGFYQQYHGNLFLSRYDPDLGPRFVQVPYFLAWKCVPLKSKDRLSFRYEIFPVNVISQSRMNQVGLYYLQAFTETYSVLAELEEKNGNISKSIALWKEILNVRPGNRKALRNIYRLVHSNNNQ